MIKFDKNIFLLAKSLIYLMGQKYLGYHYLVIYNKLLKHSHWVTQETYTVTQETKTRRYHNICRPALNHDEFDFWEIPICEIKFTKKFAKCHLRIFRWTLSLCTIWLTFTKISLVWTPLVGQCYWPGMVTIKFQSESPTFDEWLESSLVRILAHDCLDSPRQRRAFWADSAPFVDMGRLVVIRGNYWGTRL